MVFKSNLRMKISKNGGAEAVSVKYWLTSKERLIVDALMFTNKMGFFSPSLFSEMYFFFTTKKKFTKNF